MMSTRQGPPSRSTSKNQLDAVYADAVWKRLDAETVWLTCPALSKEGGRRLGADWSILGDMVKGCLSDEKKARGWVEAAVRKDPDSTALYLFAIWWACVREQHEALREERAALEETPQNFEVAHAAFKRQTQAHAAEDSKLAALCAEVGVN